MTRVIYLHGFASSPSSGKGRYFRQRFEERGIDLEIPDLAEGCFEKLTITGQLCVLERAAAGEAVSLIGSSLGGYLAALYAARHREVEKVVLLAPAFDFAARWRERLGAQQLEGWKQTGRLAVYHYADGRERNLGYQFVDDAARYEPYPRFSQAALVLHGSRDDVVPPELSEEFVRLQPNAHLVLLDSDHELLNVLDALWSHASRFLL